MTYQTLLAYCADDIGSEGVLDIATTLADRHKAHLTGLHIIPGIDPYVCYEIPVAVMQGFEKERHASVRRLEKRFEQSTRSADFVVEWRVLEAAERSIESMLIDVGHAADLIIASRGQNGGQGGRRLSPTAHRLSATGRPVLFVAHDSGIGSVAERIFIAWDGQRAATRALFGALPLLKHAGAVRLQCIDTPERKRHHSLHAIEELIDTLKRHGVAIELFRADARESEVAVDLVRFAEDWGADLIVSGCQERGTLQDWLFGSTTQYLVEQSTCPILISN